MNLPARIKQGVVALSLLFIPLTGSFAQDHFIESSLTLSGHIICGISYRYQIADHFAIRSGVQIGVPYLKPVGVHVDGLYMKRNARKNSVYAGLGFNLLVAKDERRGWVSLPICKGTLGYQHLFDAENAGYLEIWPAYFPIQKKAVPLIGLNFGYARHLK